MIKMALLVPYHAVVVGCFVRQTAQPNHQPHLCETLEISPSRYEFITTVAQPWPEPYLMQNDGDQNDSR